MYYNGQVVYDLDKKHPVVVGAEGDGQWAWSNVNYGRTTHFLKGVEGHKYDIALPKSVEEAVELMDKGLIFPAPCAVTHHWKCGNWKSNCQCQDKS